MWRETFPRFSLNEKHPLRRSLMKYVLTVAALCLLTLSSSVQAQEVTPHVTQPPTTFNLFSLVDKAPAGMDCSSGVCVPTNMPMMKSYVCTVPGCTCVDGIQCEACKVAGCTCCVPSAELEALRKENDQLKARIATLESLTRKLAQMRQQTDSQSVAQN